LSAKTRKGIWKSFLGRARTTEGDAIYSFEQLDDLAKKDFNGREVGPRELAKWITMTMAYLVQIKICIRAAHALATEEGVRLSYSHLEVVIDSGTELESDFNGSGQVDNMRSYM
jgi:hypothetical protein